MAMNPAQCKASCLSYMQANLKPLLSNITNTSNISGLTFDQLWTIITEMAAITIQHIIDNAQCQGADSHGDTHDGVKVI